jgi:predicted DNA-binding protein
MSTTTTTIRIEKSTKERLEKLGKMSDTYDMVINKMIDFFEKDKKE